MRRAGRTWLSLFKAVAAEAAVPVTFALMLLWQPLFAGESFFWGTPLLQFVPWQALAARMWRGGHLPLWNPLVGCGAPLAANYQTAAFYPLNALALLMPAHVALSWTTAIHVALSGWAMYRWGRAVGLDWFPATVGGLALAGSGFLTARAALFPSIAFTFPWLAVWLWRAEVLAQRAAPANALWLGLTLGLGLLAGHAQTAFYGGVLLAAYLLLRGLQERARAWRLWLLSAGALALGVGLAAVQLLPTAELMRHSQRSAGVDYDVAMTYSMWPWRLLTVFVPDLFGNPGRGAYWGYATYWEDALFVGVWPLLLAFSALRRRERGGGGAQPAFWAAGTGLALLLALGKNTPLFPFLFRHVPTFDLFQAPARWLAVTSVALAALAALGAGRLPRGHRVRRRGALTVVIGVALSLGGWVAWAAFPSVEETFGAATARLGVTVALIGLLLVLRARALGRRGEIVWHGAALILIALDLLVFGWPLLPTTARSLYRGRTQTVTRLAETDPEARVYWPSDPSHRNRAYDAEYRVKFRYFSFDTFGPRDAEHWRAVREIALPNAGMLDGLATVNNFEPMQVGRHVDVMAAAVAHPHWVHLMGATHLVQVSDQGAVRLRAIPDALGRAWIVPTARQVSPEAVLDQITEERFDPRQEILVEESPPFSSDTAAPINYELSLREAPNRVTIHAALDRPGYLFLADTWYPGWRATVDGVPVRILRANYTFRAIPLEAGEHTVTFVYRPASVRWGALVSLASLVSLILGVWHLNRRSLA